MQKDKITTFVDRLSKLGIKLQLAGNYPWIYIDSINGKRVTEKFQGNHGFTIAFLPIRKDQELNFTDIGEIFKLIRKYINMNEIGEDKVQDNVLYFHGRTVDGYRFTLAGKYDDDEDMLLLGVAVCSKKDQFSKKKGRFLAECRLQHKHYVENKKKSLDLYTDFDGLESYRGYNGYPEHYYRTKKIDVFLNVAKELCRRTKNNIL